MKNILIIEDEIVAAQHLQRTLAQLSPRFNVLAVIQSIEESVEYFKQFDTPSAVPYPDLCFMDIHLADGLAFHIFDQVDITCPIIFTTAYDQYALQAFKVNSIDYLLKPIGQEDLRRALDKLESLTAPPPPVPVAALASSLKHYRSHFLIPLLDKLVPVEISQIACLYIEDKLTRVLLLGGQQHIIDKPLDLIMEQLDPALFFRANRQYIVAHRAIKEISVWPIGKLALTLAVPTPDRIIISKARVPEFKTWYTQ